MNEQASTTSSTTEPRGGGPLARFRHFRWTRPFWGGLFIIVGGLIMGWLPLGPVTEIIHLGFGGIGGYLCALVLIAMGLIIWFIPGSRVVAAIIAVIVSLISFPVTNIGGLVVGMLLGLFGGAMAFGWSPDKPRRAGWRRRRAARRDAQERDREPVSGGAPR
ncbi:DUF6114 domain-containing protein [Skermania sp. ID1734]|uniref:DUF6114 domain-containing protein n=1 Tax=Skermania sp. ID1734 TaxID=2597516 RepID=UPI00163DAF3F|nr:DUF6114 domain-containing protein [Skermania sp. ID1734]